MHKSGYQPTRSQQLYLRTLVQKHFKDEVIVVHHVLIDTPLLLQLQIERRWDNSSQISFERIVV